MLKFFSPHLLLLSSLICMADVPVPHSGHLSHSGKPFTGNGYFKFSILDDAGSSIWNHDGSGSLPPTNFIELEVKNGFYSVFLGDKKISGMEELDALLLRDLEMAFLRVWFAPESNATFEQVGVDLALGATPFALVAEVSRGSPEIEQRLEVVEQILQNITADYIDPVLLAEVGYKKFSRRELTGFSLPGLDLQDANFNQAIVSDANVTTAIMDNIDLQGGTIEDSNFSLSSIATGNLAATTIKRSSFTSTSSIGVSLSRSNLEQVDFSSSNLSQADLSDSSFSDCNLTGVNFQGSSMLDTKFLSCDLSGSSLVNIDSINLDFSNSNLNNATISGSLLGAILKNTDLTGADFSGADLTNANLEGAVGFDPIDHSNVIYSQTVLPDGTSRTD